MPVIKKPRTPESPRHLELVTALVRELNRDQPTGPGPKIVEEEQRGNYLHIKVIWDEWKDLDYESRGRVIMDAYEQARPNEVTRITVALALTHAEAERLGIAT